MNAGELQLRALNEAALWSHTYIKRAYPDFPLQFPEGMVLSAAGPVENISKSL
jgi:hypothetical protein